MLLEQCNSSFISYEFFITTFLFFSSGQIFSILRTWKACQLFLCCLLCLEMDLCYHVLSSFVISCGNYLSSIESYVLLITNCGNAKFALRHTISKQCYSLTSSSWMLQICHIIHTGCHFCYLHENCLSRVICTPHFNFIHLPLHIEALSNIVKTIVNYFAL